MPAWFKHNKRTLIGLLPSLLVIIAVVLVQFRYDYVRSGTRSASPGLETAKIYLQDMRRTPCVGDVVRFRSGERRFLYFRPVFGVTGDQFKILKNGYTINGKLTETGESWVSLARKQVSGATEAMTVPAGKWLVINQAYKADRETNNWAYEFVPTKNIKSTLTHILVARDLTRIGEPITKGSDRCIRNKQTQPS